MLGHSDWCDDTRYSLQSIKDNLMLFTPELFDQINQEIVKAGHALVKKSLNAGLTVVDNANANAPTNCADVATPLS